MSEARGAISVASGFSVALAWGGHWIRSFVSRRATPCHPAFLRDSAVSCMAAHGRIYGRISRPIPTLEGSPHMKIWIDYQDDGTEGEDVPAVQVEVAAVPRIGEKVGIRQPGPMEGTDVFALDYVIDIRHYLVPAHEIRVLTSSRR